MEIEDQTVNMAFTYILYSEKLDRFYIGSCIDMERRIYEHNIGHSKFTSLGLPWKLVYKEKFDSLIKARQRERQIKKMKSKKYIERLIKK